MLLGIDPGINNCGLAIIDNSKHFKVVDTHNVKNTRKFTDEEKNLEQIYGSRAVKVIHIVNTINEYLDKYPEIDVFAIEAPFYNSLTPMAYGSLMEVISAIKYQIIVTKNLKFKMLEPLLVKKMFAFKSNAKKEVMKDFLFKKQASKEIDIKLDVETLTEHEVDAIAIAFVYDHSQKVVE